MKASNTLLRLLRWWLIWVLIYILFQYRIVQVLTSLGINYLASFLNKIDELTIIAFLPITFLRLLNDKERRWLYIVLSLPLIAFTIAGIISGFINNNPPRITALGTFSYLKFFPLMFIYTGFFNDGDDLKKLYRFFLTIAIVLVFVAFLQEIWALYSRYVIGKDITDPNTYLISFLFKRFAYMDIGEIGNWRWGFYRTPSLLSHYNLFGLICIFLLGINIFFEKRINRFSILLGIGVLLSLSRVAYLGLLFILVVRFFDKRWLYMTISILFIALTLFLAERVKSGVSQEEIRIQGSYLVRQKRLPFREYANFIALQVWRDHPLLGVGPGMFGGDVAYKYHSPIYEEYNFYEIFRQIPSLDQLWPQMLAETGVIGVTIFAELIMTIFVMLLIIERDNPYSGFLRGLGIFTVIFVVYGFSNNLNNPSLLYPYCAFLGIAFGSSKK
ncbi:MAG: O-antigen ligase family protein [Candidatus Nitrosocaldus sp.]